MTACLAEHQALVEEMRWLRQEAAQYQNFALLIMAGCAPVLGFEIAQHPSWLLPTLVIAPFPFAAMGFLFFRLHLEVYVVAAYIRDRVRPQLRDITSCPRLWEWENFKFEQFMLVSHGRRFGSVVKDRTAVAMRTTLFLFPAVAALASSGALTVRSGLTALPDTYGWLGTALVVAMFITDGLLIGVLLALLWVQGDLAKSVLHLNETDVRTS